MPLAIILIVPMCLLAAVTGLLIRGMNIDILAQIGFVVLVGLAWLEERIHLDRGIRQAVRGGVAPTPASRRAGLPHTTAPGSPDDVVLPSIFGVIILLALATGAGAEMLHVLGTEMFFGMLGVTVICLLFTPMFYVVVRRIVSGKAIPDRIAHPDPAIVPPISQPAE